MIDVSECSSVDLLTRITATWDEEKNNYQFAKLSCALVKSIEEDKNIILKGDFSKDLINALHHFLLKRLSSKNITQKLIILHDKNINPFSCSVTLCSKAVK